MHSTLSYFLVAGLGLIIAHFLTSAAELRHLRFFQMVAIPGLMLVFFYCTPSGGLPGAGSGIACIFLVAAMAFVLSPNIAHFCSVRVSNFLDRQDWTPAEEDIALRPIRRLIDEDKNRDALAELEKLLRKYEPTYEALLIKAKLLYHIGGVDETATALVNLIGLSHTTQQQLVVMELLATLEEHQTPASQPAASGSRRVSIDHELLLFPPGSKDRSQHKGISPGSYTVEETLHCKQLWLKLVGEDWGNAEICWEAARKVPKAASAPPSRGFFWRIAQISGAISTVIWGKSRILKQAESQKLFKEASQFIRQEDWHRALPLLQKASARDPDRYEIAYRWAQAVRRTADDATTANAVGKILAQSQWTASEQHMLLQLKRPHAANKP